MGAGLPAKAVSTTDLVSALRLVQAILGQLAINLNGDEWSYLPDIVEKIDEAAVLAENLAK